jgi:hypothetical protein
MSVGPEAHRTYTEMSPFGGNEERLGMKYLSPPTPEEEQAYRDRALRDTSDWTAMTNADIGAARGKEQQRQLDLAVRQDEMARAADAVLNTPTNPHEAEISNARAALDLGARRQQELLRMVGNRQSAASLQRGVMFNQLQDALATASDPRARIMGLRKAANPMAVQMMQGAVNEQAAKEGQLLGGANALRGQGLSRIQMEQTELARAVQAQLAKEQASMAWRQLQQRDAQGMALAEAGLSAVQASQGQSGLDFWQNVFPGLMNMGSAVAGAYATQPQQPYQAPASATGQPWSIATSPMGYAGGQAAAAAASPFYAPYAGADYNSWLLGR